MGSPRTFSSGTIGTNVCDHWRPLPQPPLLVLIHQGWKRCASPIRCARSLYAMSWVFWVTGTSEISSPGLDLSMVIGTERILTVISYQGLAFTSSILLPT